MEITINIIATQLWDLGYRASDHDALIKELDMTEEQASAVCKVLQHFEDREDRGF